MRGGIMRRFLIGAFTVWSLLAAPDAVAGMVADCNQSADPDLSIGGRTAAIRSGQFSGKGLATAYFNRGNGYLNLGLNRRAIQDYDKAIRLDPGDVEAYNSRGIAHASLGQYQRTIQDFDQALRMDPGQLSAYNNRGRAYHLLGQYQRAIQDFDQALRMDPGQLSAYNNRGTAHAPLGQHQRAMKDYDQALGINPGFVEAYFNRGLANGALGNADAMLRDIERAYDLSGASRVRKDQLWLKENGFYRGAVDGEYGPTMRQAWLDWAHAQ